MVFDGNNNATKLNTRKRKFGEIKKTEKSNKSQMMFSNCILGLFNKATELSVLCKAKTALIITSPNNELYTCGYPNCDAIIQQFLTGKDTIEDSEIKKQEEIVETLRLEYEAIGDKLKKLLEEEKNWQAINDEAEKSGSISSCWWNDPIDDMDLQSLEEFKTYLEKLRLNLGSANDEKKLMSTLRS
ncbi:agamous-like MADS-box protein AGL62 [Trifolium pratense]|uniref:agamous-like MADS-box protein AGL62 n=1 Tax=Trifolium pratense TaxID=57577 RepID=UPI001E696514|nr:agamous-like MADS-box protein AGL62 [Trifolium pratense]